MRTTKTDQASAHNSATTSWTKALRGGERFVRMRRLNLSSSGDAGTAIIAGAVEWARA